VGLLAEYNDHADFAGMKPGDSLVLIGETHGQLGASMYLREILGREDGAPPPVDLALERRTGDLVRGLIASGAARVVHDLSDGGLIAAVAEMALASNTGATLQLALDAPAHGQLFGEDQARYLLALTDADEVLRAATAAGLSAAIIGQAGGDDLAVDGLFSLKLDALRTAHEGWMPAFMEAPVAS
jgi:phosphoribosylformylglycinamidine synthase